MTTRQNPADLILVLPYPERIRKLRAMYRHAVTQTQKFDRLWNRKNDQLNEYNEGMGYDSLQAARTKEVNIQLKDYFGAQAWWREQAVYLATLIQTEIAMKEAEL